MDDKESEGSEDPNFVDSDNDVASDDDDVLYDRNVTDGVEAGLDRCDRVLEDEPTEGIDIEVDDLEYPSSEELLSQCSSDEDSGYRFPEFSIDSGMKNPHFEVGQLFSSAVEFREAVRTYGAMNGYNLKFKVNEDRRVQGACKLGCTWKI